jgi:transposase-like protein
MDRGELSVGAAAQLMGVGDRQAKRIRQAYIERGDSGLVHGLRGKPSNHAMNGERFKKAMDLYDQKYNDYGPVLAAATMTEEDKVQVAPGTLRRWLIDSGRWSVRRRRAKPRRWRERKEYFGQMVQMDGSDHDWLEGRGPRMVLMVMIDDATSTVFARFYGAETTAAAFDVFRRYVERFGVPMSLYVDKDSIYRTTRSASVDEQLAASAPKTQFGLAMDDLDVEIILANSPQAKGRVERFNRVAQDRLVKALRRKGITTIAGANDLLAAGYMDRLNDLVQVEAAKPEDLHRRLEADVDLALVLSWRESRTVRNDWTIAWRNRHYQLACDEQALALAGEKVKVHELLDGTIRIQYRGRELKWVALPARPVKVAKVTVPTMPRQLTNPAADHPWRGRMLPVRG